MNLVTIFRGIHSLKKSAHDIQARMEQLPRLKKTQENLVTKREEALKEAQDGIKHLKVTIHEKEVSLKTANQQVAKFTKQLDEAAGKKEYDALKVEIAHAKDQIANLENEILEAMGDVEERTAALPGIEKELGDAKTQLANFEQESAVKIAELGQRREEVLAKLAVQEASLPDDARAHYNRVAKAHGADALSEVQGRTCIACYTEITQQNANELRAGKFVPCKNCGRILYLAE